MNNEKLFHEDIVLRKGYVGGSLGNTVKLHGSLKVYEETYKLGLNFECSVGKAMSEFFLRYNSKRDGFWSLYDGNSFIGSITVDGSQKEGVFVFRFFVVDDKYQGKGYGNFLVQIALNHCKEVGKRGDKIILNTFKGLDAARHLYEKNGFKLVKEITPSKWGKHLVSQDFEFVL